MDNRSDFEIVNQDVIPKTISFVCETLGGSLGLPKEATLFDLLKGGDDDESDESVGLQSESDRGEGRE